LLAAAGQARWYGVQHVFVSKQGAHLLFAEFEKGSHTITPPKARGAWSRAI
jgi:hypothetical protein